MTNPGSVADLNLDPSDFPALGSGRAIDATTGITGASSLLSSYATQAGSGGMASQGQQQAQQAQNSFFAAGGHPGQPQREFSAEDFPALGVGAALADSSAFPHSQQQNGQLTNGAAQLRSSQEQASAAAALAHKQSLLGTMSVGAQNQARGVSNAAASTLLPDDALSQKRVS